MRFLIAAFIALGLSIGIFANSDRDHDGLVFIEDFENPETGRLYWQLADDPHLEVAEGVGADGSRGLIATFEGGPRGSERITARHNFGERGLEYSLSYDVKFDHDFQFVKGGKLHGLGPDSPITGGKSMQPGGWSARVTFKEEGSIRSYLYCQNKDGQYGAGITNPHFRFEKGEYYSVSLHAKLNENASTSDGFAHIYVNGDLVVQHDGVRFRGKDGDDTLISQFLFSAFHGGHEPHWAPRDASGAYTNVHAYFDNIAVHRGKWIREKQRK
jgi:hypothetical protein